MAVRKLASSTSLVKRYTYAKNFNIPREITTPETWKRNPCWLTLPTVSSSEQKITGVYAVEEDSCFVALSVSINTGNYTVDWGDGVVDTVAGGSLASHQYDYTNVLLANTNGPVTFQDSTNTVTRSSHGYSDGDRINFASITTTTGIYPYNWYYVVNATTDTFQLTETLGGSVINLVSDGTGNILPYKQAIITITPVAGKNITGFDLNQRHATIGKYYGTGWLDINISTPNATTTTYFGLNGGTSGLVLNSYLERANVVSLGSSINTNGFFYNNYNLKKVETLNIPSTMTDMSRFFAYCRSLENIPNFTTSNSLTNASEIFRECFGVQEVPWFNTTNVLNFNYMFYYMIRLKKVPLVDTQNATSIQYFINSDYQLKEIPKFNTSKTTNLTGFAQGSISLEYIPFLDTNKVTTLNSSFTSCYRLPKIPTFDTSSVTDFASTLYQCYSLYTLPNFSYAKAITITSTFRETFSLTETPTQLNIPAATDISYIFSYSGLQKLPNINPGAAKLLSVAYAFQFCQAIETAPLFDTSACTNFTNMFNSCLRLKSVPVYNTSAGTNFSSMFQACQSLLDGIPIDTSNATTVSSLYYGAYRIQNIPDYNFNKVLTADNLFRLCQVLTDVPALSLPLATSVTNLFYDSINIKVIPKISIPSATNASGMFQNCTSLRYVPDISFASVTSAVNLGIFASNWSLTHAKMTGMKYSFSVANFSLSDTSLNEIYTNLPTTTGQTITVTGNWGTANDNPAIATAKGWTVTG